MPENSWYKDFAELSRSEHEGLDYARRIYRWPSNLLILAPHGGGIEPGTSELAWAIANLAFSCYTFEGLKLSGNELLHITSTRFDDPRCIQLLEHSQLAVTIHGCAGREPFVLVGGLHQELSARILSALRVSGFDARDAAGGSLSGSEPGNLCNRCRAGRGVQLELSEGLRKSMFRGLKRQDRKFTTPVFHKFVGVVRRELRSAARGLPVK